jgi:hypothetical protein
MFNPEANETASNVLHKVVITIDYAPLRQMQPYVYAPGQ